MSTWKHKDWIKNFIRGQVREMVASLKHVFLISSNTANERAPLTEYL